MLAPTIIHGVPNRSISAPKASLGHGLAEGDPIAEGAGVGATLALLYFTNSLGAAAGAAAGTVAARSSRGRKPVS